MTTRELAKSVGKSVPAVFNLQKKFELSKARRYPEGYAVLLSKLIYLSTCSVSDKDIRKLLVMEKKLLELLKVDSLHDGELWFESLCIAKRGAKRLLLSGHDLGHPVRAPSIQAGLDFSRQPQEFFSHAEMGTDMLRELQRYADFVGHIQERVKEGLPVVEATAKWARRVIA